jgi:hypothetical protein
MLLSPCLPSSYRGLWCSFVTCACVSGCNGWTCCRILDMQVHEFGQLGFFVSPTGWVRIAVVRPLLTICHDPLRVSATYNLTCER